MDHFSRNKAFSRFWVPSVSRNIQQEGYVFRRSYSFLDDRLHAGYGRMQLAFVDSLLASVINKYSLGQFIMVDVDAIALAGAIYGVINIHRVSKKQSKLFSSELRQISINFDNFWQKDGQDDEIM